MWGDILSFGKIGRAGILRRVQIAARYRDPVRCAGVAMRRIVVIIRGRRVQIR